MARAAIAAFAAWFHIPATTAGTLGPTVPPTDVQARLQATLAAEVLLPWIDRATAQSCPAATTTALALLSTLLGTAAGGPAAHAIVDHVGIRTLLHHLGALWYASDADDGEDGPPNNDGDTRRAAVRSLLDRLTELGRERPRTIATAQAHHVGPSDIDAPAGPSACFFGLGGNQNQTASRTRPTVVGRARARVATSCSRTVASRLGSAAMRRRVATGRAVPTLVAARSPLAARSSRPAPI